MAEPPPTRKFMFTTSFDVGSVAARPIERKPLLLKPEQIDALKKEAYDSGMAAGQKMTGDEKTNKGLALLTSIDNRMASLTETMQAMHAQQDAKARQVAMSIARKIMPDLASKNGMQEIEAMLSAAISEMLHEPRLVVRVNESEFDGINTKVQDIASKKAYAGKVVVLADAEIAVGDCRVEWADGGMERNAAATWTDVEKVVAPADDPATKPDQE